MFDNQLRSVWSWNDPQDLRDNGKFRDGSYSLTAPSIDLANVIIFRPKKIVHHFHVNVNVHQVTTGDSGIYYCTASAPDGVSKTASVQIQVPWRNGWIQWQINARTSFLVFGGDWTSNRKYDENLGSGWWSWSLLWSYRWCSPLRSFQWSAIGWRLVKAGRLRSVDAGHRGFKSLKVSKKF